MLLQSKGLPIAIGLLVGLVLLSSEIDSLKWLIVYTAMAGGAIFLAVSDKREKYLLAVAVIDMVLLYDMELLHDENHIGSRAGYLLSLTSLTLIPLYLLWAVGDRSNSAPRARLDIMFYVFAISFFLSGILSLIHSTYIAASYFEIYFNFKMLLLFFYLCHYIKSKADLNFIVQLSLFCLLVQGVVVIIQYVTGIQFIMTGKSVEMDSLFISTGYGRSFRPGGTDASPAAAAEFIYLLLLLAMGAWLTHRQRVMQWLTGVNFTLGVLALIMTFTRGAWFCFFLGSGLFAVAALWRRWVKIQWVAIAVGVVLLIGAAFAGPIWMRVTADDKGSTQSRFPLMKLAWEMVQDKPLVGVGINNFGTVMQAYLTPETRGQWLYVVHNKYLALMAEQGAVGLLTFCLMYGYLLWLCLRCFRTKDADIAPLALGIGCALIVMLIHMVADVFDSRSVIQVFWTFAAIIVSGDHLLRHKAAETAYVENLQARPILGVRL